MATRDWLVRLCLAAALVTGSLGTVVADDPGSGFINCQDRSNGNCSGLCPMDVPRTCERRWVTTFDVETGQNVDVLICACYKNDPVPIE